MDEEVLAAINLIGKQLHSEAAKKCYMYIAKNSKLFDLIKSKKYGYKLQCKNAINEVLDFSVVKFGSSYTSRSFWLARGWNKEETEIKIKDFKNKIDYKRNSAYSKTFKSYDGMSKEEIEKTISSKRPSNIEYWIVRGYSIDEAKNKVLLHQQSASRSFVIKSSKKNNRTTTQLMYWVDKGYSLDEAKNILSKRQDTKSFSFYIYKYGIRKASLIYLQRIKNPVDQRKVLSRRSIILTLLEFRKDRKMSNEHFLNLHKNIKTKLIKDSRGHASKESLIFLNPLKEYFEPKMECHLGIGGCKEFTLMRNSKQKFRYDFCIPALKLIIEYDGFYFHQDATLDQEKDRIAKKHGFNILRLEGLSPNKLRNVTIDENFSMIESIIVTILSTESDKQDFRIFIALQKNRLCKKQ